MWPATSATLTQRSSLATRATGWTCQECALGLAACLVLAVHARRANACKRRVGTRRGNTSRSRSRFVPGRRRRVTLSQFKGVTYVAIREYYEKGGEELPSAKGLNMAPEAWAKLMAGAPQLTGALRAAQGK